jgi:hypothetical protein
MLLILGAIGIYCILSAAVLVVLCMNSARMSEHEGWEEDWSPAEPATQKVRAAQPVRGEVASRA